MSKPFWTYDCETDPFKRGRQPEAFLWGLYSAEHDCYFEFDKTEDFARFVKNQDAVFYAHNGGGFDNFYLAPWINNHEKILMIGSRLVQCRMGAAELRDSYALLPFPQSQFAKKVEIEDWEIMEKENRYKPENWAKIRERCRQDCITLYDTIQVFFDTYGRHLTAATASMKQMQKIEKIKVENSGDEFFNSFKKYYFGGRCECLKPGEYHEKLTYLDINSAYPDAMLSAHPHGTSYKTEYARNPEIHGNRFYTVDARSYGAFCRRQKNGLKFDWSGEENRFHVTGWELEAALETGMAEIVRHVEQKVFEETKDFKKFINHFWSIRQTSKKGTLENVFSKLMMNSCYGKYAANPENYEVFMFTSPAYLRFMTKENGWDIAGDIAGKPLICRPLEADDMRYYNVATAASITGHVRAKLLRALAAVKNPVYCDTDSIILTGNHNLPLSDKLGDWKLEGEFAEGYFAGKKLYALKYIKPLVNKDTGAKTWHKIATKGSKLTFQEVKKVTRGKTVIYRQDAPNRSWKNKGKKEGFLERKIKKTA